MSTTTLQVIDDYVQRVRESVRLLQEHFRIDNLMEGIRERTIPKRGTVDEHGLAFTFHGIGCLVEEPDAKIDFDFGPDGTVGGFDSWRILQFLESCNDYDTKQFTQGSLESDIQTLVASGVVLSSKWEPSLHLFYLAKNHSWRFCTSLTL